MDITQVDDQEMGATATQDATGNINYNAAAAAEYSDEEREAEMYRTFMQKKRK
jgi:GH25 family lysozyme M1 (1,4-beta-N-acetylmuramidase)